MASSLNGLSAFTSARDWQSISSTHRGGEPPRLTWDMLKKAVGEEDKYQSKKNWSSTKGRGNRKAPIARRLDAEVLKKFGVYPEGAVSVAGCVNAHYLKEHQEQNCAVSTHKREEKKNTSAEPAAQASAGEKKPANKTKDPRGAKRLGSEALSEDEDEGHKSPKVTKKMKMKLEKERREKERAERKEQQRLERERKKREKEEKKERELAKQRQPLDLDKQCGVVSEPGSAPCSRSLTCKTHSMAMKRAVAGRRTWPSRAAPQQHAMRRLGAQAAKSGNAVRSAMAIALGGEAGAIDESFFDDSDEERGSDEEAEQVH
ncbi:SCA7-domain-containing protein [Linderina pennispora]|uniref:SCA7-domain-containing protein n=1 Tax=Linderina pennispora TaxID=61395 RepID=A0A1Y1WBD9_9FUNG|nr:SCA7-domain-containing protein [Linderina pennispora]ORX70860.1 SCA7-domain-containing protein [Linderina pennispora]